MTQTSLAAGTAFWLAAPAAAIRVALGLLFLRAAWGKWRDLPAFGDIVRDYRLLPDGLARPAAVLLAGVEFMLGGMLLSGQLAALAGGVAAALLLLFAGAMAINLSRGRADISCGCLPAHATRDTLSWSGVMATALLVPPALLAAAPWHVADTAILLQAALAGLLLFTLHDTAVRLAATPRAGARS